MSKRAFFHSLCGIVLFAAAASSAGACESGHWIDDVLADEEIVKLEDGSLWKVNPADAVTASVWLATDDVIHCDDKIVNVEKAFRLPRYGDGRDRVSCRCLLATLLPCYAL
jgi:hypothetical protein